MSESAQTNRGSSSEGKQGAGFFPLTRWSQIIRAKSDDEAEKFAALTHIAERYWEPVYRFLLTLGNDPHKAEDLTQAFFLHCIEKKTFAAADQAKGKFRGFVCTSVENFAIRLYHKEKAKKRSPEGGAVNAEDCILVDQKNAVKAFDRAYALGLFNIVFHSLDQHYVGSQDRAAHLTLFRKMILQPLVEGTETPKVKDVAAELGIPENRASKYLATVRADYRRLLHKEILSGGTVEVEVQSEIRDLRKLIADN